MHRFWPVSLSSPFDIHDSDIQRLFVELPSPILWLIRWSRSNSSDLPAWDSKLRGDECGNCTFCLTGEAAPESHWFDTQYHPQLVDTVCHLFSSSESPRVLARFAIGCRTPRIDYLKVHTHEKFGCLRSVEFQVRVLLFKPLQVDNTNRCC